MGEDGRPRGFAHAEFETHEMAKEAMKLAGKNLDGREVRLNLSQSKKREGGFGGGRGGSFGGGRGGSFGGGGRGGRFVIISYLICTLALITAVQSIKSEELYNQLESLENFALMGCATYADPKGQPFDS